MFLELAVVDFFIQFNFNLIFGGIHSKFLYCSWNSGMQTTRYFTNGIPIPELLQKNCNWRPGNIVRICIKFHYFQEYLSINFKERKIFNLRHVHEDISRTLSISVRIFKGAPNISNTSMSGPLYLRKTAVAGHNSISYLGRNTHIYIYTFMYIYL